MRTSSSSGMPTAGPHAPSVFCCALGGPCFTLPAPFGFHAALSPLPLQLKTCPRYSSEASQLANGKQRENLHMKCPEGKQQSVAMCPVCAAKYSHSEKKYGVTIQTSSMEMEPRGSYRTHRVCSRHTSNRRSIRIVYPSINCTVFSKYSLKFQVRFPSIHPERAWSSQRHNASWWYCPALLWCPWTWCLGFNHSRSQVQPSTDSAGY